jgi:[ribosomal protein S18]-alanine N-acetyltransferase
MDVKIEDAMIRMLNDLYEVEKQCFQGEAFSKQQISYLLTDYNAVSFAAKVNDEIAGFIIGRIDLVRNRLVGHIMTIDVAPPYRRMGIAQRLMLEVEGIFLRKGVGEIRLEVREGNFAGLRLYEKLGYRKVSVLENYYGASHGLYLKKTLK